MHPIDHEIRSLKTEHERLEAELAEELARPHPDEVRVARIKREKLRNKDRQEELRRLAERQGAA